MVRHEREEPRATLLNVENSLPMRIVDRRLRLEATFVNATTLNTSLRFALARRPAWHGSSSANVDNAFPNRRKDRMESEDPALSMPECMLMCDPNCTMRRTDITEPTWPKSNTLVCATEPMWRTRPHTLTWEDWRTKLRSEKAEPRVKCSVTDTPERPTREKYRTLRQLPLAEKFKHETVAPRRVRE
jgi:hypothetical protein